MFIMKTTKDRFLTQKMTAFLILIREDSSNLILFGGFIEAHLGETSSSLPDHHSKTSITLNESCEIFGTTVHTRVVFTLHCGLLKCAIA